MLINTSPIDSSPPATTKSIIMIYTRAFEEVFACKPSLTTVDRGQAVQLAKKLATEHNARTYIRAYFALDDKWLRSQGYPLRLMSRSMQPIAIALAAKKRVSSFEGDPEAQELPTSL